MSTSTSLGKTQGRLSMTENGREEELTMKNLSPKSQRQIIGLQGEKTLTAKNLPTKPLIKDQQRAHLSPSPPPTEEMPSLLMHDMKPHIQRLKLVGQQLEKLAEVQTCNSQ
mmetsp:Transcript_14798/g.27390  ORF Transcript_14798/g.27390 Transcript_14798/m.27390 type:complete len:111 (+) Transcript_14798:538-870(+)